MGHQDGVRPYVLRVEVPGLPALINQNGQKHWAVKWRENTNWQRTVALSIPPQMKPKKPLSKSKITLTRVSALAPDTDNLAGSFKSTIDALKKAGIIEDDSPKHVEMHFEWEPGKRGKGKIKILVEEVVL